ncbi:DUF4868 domain-containing protein [Vibrio sp.]|nr:DUF4868 domain-containing protein [Vibrio sp.]
MINGFNFNDIVNTEFSFRVEEDDDCTFQSAPTDLNIKSALRQMLMLTANEFNDVDAEILPYEVSEKYSSKEILHTVLHDPIFDEVIEIRDLDDTGINPDSINNPALIPYYRVRFYDSDNNVVVAVRKASYFKSILKQRSRLVRLVDDSLESCEDSIFKLDFDFDFLIVNDDVYILRPANFESIVNLGDEVLERAADKVDTLEESLDFIDFDNIRDLVGRSKRAARLVISVSSRDDLDQISEDNIIELSERTGVELVEDDGLLRPRDGEEIEFLEVLDRRRYVVELIDGNQEAYRAPSRQPIRA